VRPLPAHRQSLRATLEEIGPAVDTAAELARAVNAYKSSDHPEKPTLWMEFHASSEAVVTEDLEAAECVRCEGRALEVEAARTEEEQEQLWEARNHACYAAEEWYSEDHMISTDICVHIGRLGEAIAHTRKRMGEHSLEAPIVSRVGDGNYHVCFHVPRTTRTRGGGSMRYWEA
jgi:D-lactate dehydrogenase (cytochrome)